jgi:phosphoglycolate phosphatase
VRFEVEAVVFDLDGTLVDSVPDLALAVDAMMVDLGLQPCGERQVRSWVGNGAPRLIKRALTGDMEAEPDDELLQRAVALFEQHYWAQLCVASRLYPGVLDGLERLRQKGLLLACVTNKPTQFTLPLLEQLGLSGFFHTALGGDATERKKPAPDALLLAAERLGVVPSRMLMVGDSINDVGAARNAGCPVVCVPYGYNHGVDIATANPDRMIETIADVPALLLRAA